MPDLQRSAAAMLVVGFDGLAAPDGLADLIARGVSGAVLFGRNVQSPRQVADLCGQIKSLAARPILTCIDQEGGRVRRLRDGFTAIPSMRAVGRTGDETLAREIGRVLARELRAVNIDMNLAPSLDVDTNPANPVIGQRSFGASPELVSRMGAALIRGLQADAVAACGKHFPGHGDTSQDSHFDLPRLPHSLDRLNTVELPPFSAAIQADVAAIMTSHVVFEPIDPEFPATMSSAVLDGILRKQMRFDGLILSDDLEMKAIAANFDIEEVLVRGANAGIDLFLLCHDEELQHKAIDLLASAIRNGEISTQRLAESKRRIASMMNRFVRPPTDGSLECLNSPEHRAVVQRVSPEDDPVG